MAFVFGNIAKMTSTTAGTGTLTLSGTVSGFKSFANAGVGNGDRVTYIIENGDKREVGIGTYSTSGPTLSRDTIYSSTNSDAAESLSGTSYIAITVPAEVIESAHGNVTKALTPHKNLTIANDGTNPAYQIDVAADVIDLFDSDNRRKSYSSFSGTVDLTVSGANGLDTSTEANSTWYYIWVIAKEDDTKAVLLSTSATAPTMPTGYTYKGLVGAAYNDSGGNFLEFNQRNHAVAVEFVTVVSSGTATTSTSFSIAAAVPSIATSCSLQMNCTNTSAASRVITVSTDSGGLFATGVILCEATVGLVTETPIYTAQTLYYKVSNATSTNVSIYVRGWRY